MRSLILITPLLLCAGTAAGEPLGAAVQGIALYSYGYNPDPIVLPAGKPVTLNFVNRATTGHDFTAKKFLMNSSCRFIANISASSRDIHAPPAPDE